MLENFIEHHDTMPWIEGDRWVVKISTANNIQKLIKDLIKPDSIHQLKVGKNIKKQLLENYSLEGIEKFTIFDESIYNKLKAIKDYEINYKYSNIYNKICLGEMLDNYYRYGQKSTSLDYLNTYYGPMSIE